MAINVKEQINSREITRNIDGDFRLRVFRVWNDAGGSDGFLSPSEAVAALLGSEYNGGALQQGSGVDIGKLYQESSTSPQYLIPVQQQDTQIISENVVDVRVQYATVGGPGAAIPGSFEYSVGSRQDTDYFGYYEDQGAGNPPFPLVRNAEPLYPNGDKGVSYERGQGMLSFSRLIDNPNWQTYESLVNHTNGAAHGIFNVDQLLLAGYDTQQLNPTMHLITFRFDVDPDEAHPHQRCVRAEWIENPEPPDVPHWEEDWTHVYERADFTDLLTGIMGVA
jgi:hypothetical protein